MRRAREDKSGRRVWGNHGGRGTGKGAVVLSEASIADHSGGARSCSIAAFQEGW